MEHFEGLICPYAAAVADDKAALLDGMADRIQAELEDEAGIVRNIVQQHVHLFPKLQAASGSFRKSAWVPLAITALFASSILI